MNRIVALIFAGLTVVTPVVGHSAPIVTARPIIIAPRAAPTVRVPVTPRVTPKVAPAPRPAPTHRPPAGNPPISSWVPMWLLGVIPWVSDKEKP